VEVVPTLVHQHNLMVLVAKVVVVLEMVVLQEMQLLELQTQAVAVEVKLKQPRLHRPVLVEVV
jgi:hypothetical protein